MGSGKEEGKRRLKESRGEIKGKIDESPLCRVTVASPSDRAIPNLSNFANGAPATTVSSSNVI